MKKKTCDGCGIECYLWKARSKTQLGLCKSCALKQSTLIGNIKISTKTANKVEKKPSKLTKTYSIPNVSEKQKERLKRYRKLRDEYMEKHKVCEARLEGCTVKSTDLHHKKSRIGEDLFRHFCALCRNCHNRIETMGSEVYELGFKIKRTEK